MGANWLKMRALVALFTFELGPPHIDGWASGGSSEEIVNIAFIGSVFIY